MRGLDSNKRLFQSLKNGELKGFLELVKNNKEKYFLGIRDEYVNIYYKGGNLLRISHGKKMGSFKLEFDKKYFGNSDELVPEEDNINKWLQVIPKLETYIKRYQEGDNPKRQIKNEKMAQQKIINNINSSRISDYYIIDMEYSCPGIGYGRFDYVAIKKKKDSSEKYRLALIELKYGTSAFGTSLKNRVGQISYGCGIVGHAINFSRFVYGFKNHDSFERAKVHNTEYDTLEFLRKEMISILKNKAELGLFDIDGNNMSDILQDDNIDISENNIETLLLCVACQDENKAKNTISKYLGLNEGAKYNVNKLKNKGEVADNFLLKCFVTKDKNLEYLSENQFTDLTMKSIVD